MRRFLCLAVTLLPAWVHAQLVESIEVRVTNVEVVVTDRSGNPVTGLTQADFEVYENGKAQTITNFYAVERPSESISAAAVPEAATAAASEAPAPATRKRRIVFFIDHGSLEPMQRRSYVRMLDRELARLVGPGDEGMVVMFQMRPVVIEHFTTDVALLRRAIHDNGRQPGAGVLVTSRNGVRSQILNLYDLALSLPPGQRPPIYTQAIGIANGWADQAYSRQQALVRGLSSTVAHLAGIEGRKVLVVATGSMPESAGLEMIEYAQSIFRKIMPGIPFGGAMQGGFRSTTLDLVKLAKKANTDGVTMYMIDANGSAKNVTAADEAQAVDGSVNAIEQMNTAGALQLIADLTGGTALTGTHNFKAAFDTIARDLGSYYSLGYRPGGDAKGNRNISVKVRKPGLTVRSRKSWAPKTQVEQVQDRVIANVFRPETSGAFAIEVALRGNPKKTGAGVFQVPLRVTFPSSITLLPDGADLTGGFAVYLVVGNDKGDLSNVIRNAHPIRIPAGNEKAVRAKPWTYDLDVGLRAGRQIVSIAVVDQISNEAAFVTKEIHAQ